MYSGVSGMKGFQTKLDVIGNNIANVNTVGYKKSTINFQDLLSQTLSSSGVNPMQVGLGSTTSAINVIHTPGSSMTTGVGTDLAIMGDGFFIVQNPSATAPEGQYLTRAGNFVVNAVGDLVTSQGYKVLGFNSVELTAEEANPTTTVAVTSANAAVTAATVANVATAAADLATAAEATAAAAATSSTASSVERTNLANAAKAAISAATAAATVAADPSSTAANLATAAANLKTAVDNLRTELNPILPIEQAKAKAINVNSFTIPAADPADPDVTITFDSFTINRIGEVIGKEADGTETTIGNIAIAQPANPSGLRKFGGSLYEMTSKADTANSIADITGTVTEMNTEIGTGMIEMSNVDLTEEFTEMIIAQRGFQANSRIITTSDEILQEVVNLKR